jgi:cytochrome c553
MDRPLKSYATFFAITFVIFMAAVAYGASQSLREFYAAVAAKPNVLAGATHFETCLACHGRDGGGSVDGNVPAIAGQYFQVLIRQLVDFRHNKRWDIRMEHFVDRHHLTNAQAIADVARYVANLPRDYQVGLGSGEDLQLGAKAYQAKCAACHGADGIGSDASRVPRIAHQHSPYIVRQMQDAADGRRPNMNGRHATLARSMSFEEFQVIADYLSRKTR